MLEMSGEAQNNFVYSEFTACGNLPAIKGPSRISIKRFTAVEISTRILLQGGATVQHTMFYILNIPTLKSLLEAQCA